MDRGRTVSDAVGGLRFEAGDARLEVSPAHGGRIVSLQVGGQELLVTEGMGPVAWGSFPMVPFAGRVRHGAFSFGGRSWQLPVNWPPHAIHGFGFDRPWTVVDERTLSIGLADEWPFRGSVVQRFDLAAGALLVTMELTADEPMPASMGWHPWFRRRLEPGGPELELRFAAEAMFVRDDDGIPTGELMTPTAGPWDDCFTGVWADPVLIWPGVLALEIGSSCAFWVVYDEQSHAMCVEPQTAPPDALNQGPTIVEPGRPLTATMEWRWRPL
jgi:aldose 1-epimerase